MKNINDEILEILSTPRKDLQKKITSGKHSATADTVARFLEDAKEPTYKTINTINGLLKTVNGADFDNDNVLKIEVLQRSKDG
jgi:hypothetical protein